MLPEDTLSTQAVVTGYPDPVKQPGDFLVDWERGGIALNDTSQGMLVQVWRLDIVRDALDMDLWHAYASAPAAGRTLLFSDTGITEGALSFDQNMNPFVVYTADGQPKMYWYDSVLGEQTTTDLPLSWRSLRCTIDDKRVFNVSNSDNVLAYIRDGWLCVRYQRTRYTDELQLAEVGSQAELVSVAMNSAFRLQFRVRQVTANINDGRFLVQANPFLSDVVMDLCRRAGIDPLRLDVNDLYGDTVAGLKVDTDEGMTVPLDQLRDVFFFDKAEVDKKLRFLKRGRDVVARIPYTDLVRGNPTTLKQERVDEAKLPREVNINHLDPDGGFAKNKQYAHRRSNMVKARGKKNVDTQVVLTVDQAATAADTKLRIFWNELIEYKFTTTIKWSELTVTDVIEVEDRHGVWHRMRIEEKNEDTNIEWQCAQDAGQRTYGSVRAGHGLPPPVSTTPGVVGETFLEIIDISPLRDQDDELGLYVAAAGAPGMAWTGYQLLVSVDGGTTYAEAMRTDVPATMGETLADVAAEPGHDFESTEVVQVTTNFPLVSIDAAQLAAGQNRFALGGEVCQFQTATLEGMVDTLYHYTLSGLRRALYGTTAPMWPAGTRFVLLDDAVVFVQAQRNMIGVDLYYKPVSFGHTEDETVPTAYLFDAPESQVEWTPDDVAASRDAVTDDVTVTFTGRPRLGQFGAAPYHSKYFRGYRVKFSDDHVIDTMAESVVYEAAPAGVTVQVAGLNEITGVGPYSAAVAT